MGRANAFVIGSIVLAPLILGIEGYVLFRPHLRPELAKAADLPAEAPAPLPVVATSPSQERADPEETPLLQAATAETAPEPSQAPEPATLAAQRELVVHRREVVQQADEKVFDALNLPDAQRAVIRTIDDQYARTLQSVESSSSDSASVDLTAEHTRRAAIGNVLGADSMRDFTFQERRAERRARSQLRAQMLGKQ